MNFSILTAFDFSEITQGATLSLDVNVLRGSAGSLGLSFGAGFLGCLVIRCTNFVVHFPVALRGGVSLGGVVELTARVGVAPSLVFRDGGSGFLAKFLVGGGLFFPIGRGGIWLGIDVLPNAGLAHVISIGWML